MTDAYTGPERRIDWHTPENCAGMQGVERRFQDGKHRMQGIEDSVKDLRELMMETHIRFEEKLDANSKATETAAAATEEILDILVLGKSFFRIAGYLGTFIKWSAGIAVAVLGLWYTIHNGKPPP